MDVCSERKSIRPAEGIRFARESRRAGVSVSSDTVRAGSEGSRERERERRGRGGEGGCECGGVVGV